MKNTIIQLTAAALLLAVLHAEEPVGVNALHEKQADYAGKAVTVTGLVDRVSSSRRMVILIDASEATCIDACDRKNLVVQVPDAMELPAKGAFVTAVGTLAPGSNPPQLTAASIKAGNR